MASVPVVAIVAGLAVAASAGCRQIAGIHDTTEHTDGAASADAPRDRTDGPSSDAGIDAVPAPDGAIDAVPFSPQDCPSNYNDTNVASPNSRYRTLNNDAPFAIHNADCNDDYQGWTHLIILDGIEEATIAANWNSSRTKYVGAVQAPGQVITSDNWFKLTGGPITSDWSLNGPQPDDSDDVENGEESLAVIQGVGSMHDVSGQNQYWAICECDGVPIDPTVAAYLP